MRYFVGIIWIGQGIRSMLMASHVYLALHAQGRPESGPDLVAYLGGAIAPDVRYLQADLPRQATHSWQLGEALQGPWGAGYRHHLAVDDAFYGRCEAHPVFRRIGAMNLTILAEIHALRRIAAVPQFERPGAQQALTVAGISMEALSTFTVMSNEYLQGRDIDQAIEMLAGTMKERAAHYLSRWNQWGKYLQAASRLGGPLLECLFHSLSAEVDLKTEEGRA